LANSELVYPLKWNCRLPKPPGDDVQCDTALGVWYILGNYDIDVGLGGNSSAPASSSPATAGRVEIGSSINVVGNLTISPGVQLVVSGDTLINSSQCSTLSGSLTVELTAAEALIGNSRQQIITSGLECLSGQFSSIQVTILDSPCLSGTATPESSTLQFSVLISITDNGQCSNPGAPGLSGVAAGPLPGWVIPVGMTAGVAVLALAVFLIVFFVPCIAIRVLPGKNLSRRLRSQIRSQASPNNI
jgi:hypothetical protein